MKSTKSSGQRPEVRTSERWFQIPIAVLVAFPIALLAMPYTFAAVVAVHLGRWPYYGHPDPKDLPKGFNPFHILEIAVPAVLFVVLVFLIILMITKYVRQTRRLPTLISILPVTWLLSFALLVADPFGVLYGSHDFYAQSLT